MVTNTSSDTSPGSDPQLAAPGAGLPRVELVVARMMVWWMCRTKTRGMIMEEFVAERERISTLARGASPEAASTRVLIKRIPGIEDSSRYWSLWMTLDHLRIVNNAMAGVMMALAAGAPPPGKASTASVKPNPSADAAALEGFETSCELLLSRASEIADLKTKARYAHPWFGPLDAHGWFGVAAMHMGLHRGQIERILAGLRRQ